MAFFARPQSRSAAVKIVAPPSSDRPTTPSVSGSSTVNGNSSSPSRSRDADKKDSTQRQCRNILIHGYCKFKDKGCQYYHPPDQSDVFVTSSLTDSSANIQSSNSSAALAEAVNAPVFVPRATQSPPPDVFTPAGVLTSSTSVPVDFSPAEEPNAIPDEHQTQYDMYAYHPESEMPSFAGQMETIENGMYNMDLTSSYYQPQSAYIRQPLNYHLYTDPIPTPPHLAGNHFISDDIREELLKRSETIHTAPAPGLNLPEELQGYHTLVPLEARGTSENYNKANLASWVSMMYRATNSRDGRCYAFRRVENFRLMNEAAFKAIDTWTRIRHPNIVSVREAFTTRAFNDSSLVVVYDYHPSARSLFELYFRHGGTSATTFTHSGGHHHNQRNNNNHNNNHNSNNGAGGNPGRIPEKLLWSYVTQIACGIKAVHDAGAAVRMVDVSKVLVTGRDRVRISSCGVLDVLFYDTPQELLYLQQQDIVMIARLILSLCCANVHAMGNVHKSMEVVSKYYSPEVKSFVMMLLPKHTPVPNIQQVLNTLSSKLNAEVDSLQMSVDRLEGNLMGELENGRLVRLLCKFGFINERPEFDRDQRWSETGDRYIIKLFRDYVFHQVDENGNPVVNLSHVLACLNKLDVGTDERIMLVSRDEQSCLVVSYREVKSCIESAFGDLARGTH